MVGESARRLLTGHGPQASVAIALSGGIDSVVLLNLLASLRGTLGIHLRAFHVNHQISPHAGTWEHFCADLCSVLGVDFRAARVDLGDKRTSGLEADARRARYHALYDMTGGRAATVIALGHHADDQAETVLIQLLRGGSARGLAGMPEWAAPPGQPALWRPLLKATRADIASHAAARKLRWVEDESNGDRSIRRNHLRASVMPRIEDGFPDYRAALSRAAAGAAETAVLLQQLAAIDAREAVIEGRVVIDPLRRLGAPRTVNLLRHLLRSRGISVPAADRLSEFARQIIRGDGSTHPSLDLGNGRSLCAERGMVDVVAVGGEFRARWLNQRVLDLPHGRLLFGQAIGLGFCAALVPPTGFIVQPRGGGERIKLAPDRPHRTMKNVMREAGIGAASRKGWPLLIHDGAVVAVPGIGIGVDWHCPPDAPGWTVEWRPHASLSAQTPS